ncbi:MAG: DNA-processing protein DprA [Flammeovirgaceae bacterium]
MNTSEVQYYIALGQIPGIGRVLAKHLISYCGSAEQVFKEKKGKLLKIPGIGEKVAERILKSNFLAEAEQELVRAEKNGVTILSYHHQDYPERLRHVIDAPLILYAKGNIHLNAVKVISIVGTRKATAYGLDLTNQLVEQLAAYSDLLVVSGLAYGIDICAHRKCVQLGIPTIGVLANGLDTIYPKTHAATAQKMQLHGGLITENRLGTLPDAPKFPERNRIIAGMSDAVIVVEAARKGGALITAEIANSFNRDVFAYPGDIHKTTSEGCNNLIKQHKAHLMTSAKDLAYIMGWDVSEKSTKPASIQLALDDVDEQKVVNILKEGELQIDQLSYKSQIPIGTLASILLNLEFQGFVKSMPGKVYGLAIST